MYNITTNFYVFVILIITLAFELLITKLLDITTVLPWGFTIAIYFMFVLYQILIKINEDTEKSKVKELLLDILDAINGIPIINKNEKLIIKWDIVFKKLVENKEFGLYDKVVKVKTHHIDSYVNKYPSLLIDDSIDLRESKYNADMSSTIKGRNKRASKSDENLINDEENKRKLFINDIKSDTLSFCNYNSSIYLDVILKNEYVPEKAPEIGIEYDPNYDGFSVWMIYKENKYNVVPRIMMQKKVINKQRWLFDNIDELLNCAEAIVKGENNFTLLVDNYKLLNYIEDMPSSIENKSYLQFKVLQDAFIVFTGMNQNVSITAYCELKTGYNRFEVMLKGYELKEGENNNKIEIEKTVAIGSSFQPIVTILEKMPVLIKNIELVIDNKDINSIVIS